MRRVLLIYNEEKPEALAALDDVREVISRHGEIAVERTGLPSEKIEDAGGAEIVVVMGGDGTLLAQTRRCAHLGLPMLGINLGKVGFLAEFGLGSFERQAEKILGGDEITCRSLVRVGARIVGADGGTVFESTALNDVVITAGPPYRLIELGLELDGERGPVIRGDGVVVSTATGSTAYNLSAGGPIIEPTADALSITAIAAHSLAFRPIVVSASTAVGIDVLRSNDSNHEGTTLVLDGQVDHRVRRGERVEIRRDGTGVRFVVNPERTYWRTLSTKLHWGAEPSGDEPGSA